MKKKEKKKRGDGVGMLIDILFLPVERSVCCSLSDLITTAKDLSARPAVDCESRRQRTTPTQPTDTEQ